MGLFLLQLRLLLWKNFTLKRRRPVVLIFEVVIPLVLFIILVGIRQKQPAQKYSSQHFPQMPLPSAGLISVMQAFCDNGQTDPYGFFRNSNATVTDFLLRLNSVAENNNFFQPKFTLDELNEIPRIYKSIVEDPINVKQAFYSNDFEIRPANMFNNVQQAESFFVRNLSFDAESVRYVLYKTSLNKTKLYSLLFSFPVQSQLMENQHDIDLLFNEVEKTQIVSPQVNASSFPFSAPSRKDILLNLKPKNFPSNLPSTMIEPLAEDGIFYKYVNGDKGKHDALWTVFGLNANATLDDSLQLIKSAVLDTLLTDPYDCGGIPHDFTLISCNDQLTVKASQNDREQCKRNLSRFYQRFCNLSVADRSVLHDFTMKELNTTLLSERFQTRWKEENLYARIGRLAKDVNTFVVFKKTIRAMVKLSDSLPQGYCTTENTTVHMPSDKKAEEDSLNDVEFAGAENIMLNRDADVENLANATKSVRNAKKKPNLPYALLKIWKAMQKTVCGKVFEFQEENVNSLKDMGLSKYQIEKLELLIHVLYNNPKVLYTPTGTQASQIIEKANQTFVLFDKINQYAKRVLDVGEEIKKFLELPTTEENLIILKEMQGDIVRSPFYSLLYAKPAIQEFLSDTEITSKEIFLKEIETIMMAACSWQELMSGLTFNIFKGFRTEDEMLTYFKTKAYFENITVLAGVVFHMNNDGSLPNHMIYKIRQNFSLTMDTKRVRGRFWFPGPRVWGYNYYYFGFVWVQDILERAMISLYAERDVTGPGSYLQQFPYPCYIQDRFLFMIQHVMPLCLTISWVYSVAILVQHIVYEKEQRLKEVMKMMGLKNGPYVSSWFLTSFSQMTITIGILTLVLKYGKVLTYSNPWIVFFTMEVFSVAIIMFSFLVSALYSKAKLAAACAGIIYFMSYVPYMYIAVREESANEVVNFWVKAAASLLAPTAFGLGAKYFAFYEEIGVGVQWSNINTSPAEDDKYNLGAVINMLIIDALYYGILFWYIENIHPGAFGLPRPWYFPLQKSYWLGYDLTEEMPSSPINPNSKSVSTFFSYIFSSIFQSSTPSGTAIDQELPSNEYVQNCNQLYEAEHENLVLGVYIGNLCKRYKGSRKYAVKELNLNLYEGQITAILGHNGAGKTTTLSILTGLFPPTSGYAMFDSLSLFRETVLQYIRCGAVLSTLLIYGHDIRTHMDLIRRSLGMCPQHNVLFDDLTLEEHMWFYSRLKSQGLTDFDTETDKLIADLKLPQKRFHKVSTLSGGMKRKLSVAIAFVGGSKTVILDEPTAGVDPYARRAIWDLIIKYKKGRTILLSTHHMDEADILGDKIAIMESGRLKCFGSPLYLKNHLGEGYYLCIVKTLNEDDTSISSRCCQRDVTEAIQRLVPTARFVSESKHELHYLLPLDELRAGNFVHLFKMLAITQEQLFINSFGVKSTTLEEVFMRVISERRNSDTSDKVLPVSMSTGHPPGHSRQASLGTASQVHSRNLSRDMGQLTAPVKQTTRRYSSDTQISKVIHCHSRQSSADFKFRGTIATTPLLPQRPYGSHKRGSSMGQSTMQNYNSPGPDLGTEHPNNSKVSNSASNVHSLTRQESKFAEMFREGGKGTRSTEVTDESVHVGELQKTGPETGMNPKAGTSSVEQNVPKCDGSGEATTAPLHGGIPMKDLNSKGGKSVSTHRFSMKRGHTEDDGANSLLLEDERECSAQVTPGAGKHSHTVVEPVDTLYIRGNKTLLCHQFWALLCKRYLFTRKNIEGLFSQILLPAFFVSVAMSVALTAPVMEEIPEMILSPSQFYNFTQKKGSVIAFANNKLDLQEKNIYEDADSGRITSTLSLPSGVGAICVLKDPHAIQGHKLNYLNKDGPQVYMEKSDYDNLCESVFTSRKQYSNFFVRSENVSQPLPSSRERKYPICTCNEDNTGFVCPSYGYTDPDIVKLVSRDNTIDISGQNESQYYLYTTDMFRLTRYGGLSFGLLNSLVPHEFARTKKSPSMFKGIAVRHAAKIWFNNQGFHSIPIFVNVMNNAILRANIPPEKGSPAAYGITVINHPFPNSQTIFSQDEILQGNDVLIAIFIIVAMSFVPASFVLFLVYERASKSKHLQIISGVHRIVYWVANYIWDILNYTVPAAFCIVILLIFDIPAYTSKQNFPAVVSLFLMYGWSITPVMYPASFVFKDPSSAYISLIVGNLFVGITCIVTSFLLEVFSYDELLGEVHVVLKSVFLVFPNYALGHGIMNIAFNEYYNQFLLTTGQYHKVKSPFAWDIISRNLVAMAVTGITFFIITLLCEYNFFRKPRSYRKFIGSHRREEEDTDVFNEKKRVARSSADEDILTVKGLTKVYHTRKTGKHLVVDDLSWGIPPGECFGLLGVNGAGKSSTFRMLTGDTRITRGDAFINGFSVKNELHAAYKFIGYCPQFDALYDELSARDHLNLYATLRGVLGKSRDELVEWALAKLDLNQFSDRPVGTYSGGNKRKVSTAIALIGGPSLIFLDEPTTGMDPYSKRFLWDLILSLVKEGKSIVFTSHSMEECENLCTRLAIMVNGCFKCLGSTQHLKNRFGDGYSIKIKTLEIGTEDVEEFFRENFPLAVLKEKHYNCLHYEIASQFVYLDDIFFKMELAVKELFIHEYSVSQNTLDNVFINFVKDQTDQCSFPQASVASGVADEEGSTDGEYDEEIRELPENGISDTNVELENLEVNLEILPDIVP